jgi:predicted O-methyltransferase YrrM
MEKITSEWFTSTANRVRGYLIKKAFPVCQLMGFHVLNNHYYSPIPDTRTLRDDLWLKCSELIGIDINEKKQLALLSLFTSTYKKEYMEFPKVATSIPYEYYSNNSFFGSVDGAVLFCMIRHFKPRRIFEIGSGYSTYLSAQAVLKNKQENNDYECKLVAVEPYPNEIIKTGFPGLSKLISREVQDVPLSEFQKLQSNDILFIDSSHVLKIGSDVQYEYLEILPRLNKGVLVHFHDIFLPAEYNRDWILKNHVFWNEQYLLQSFLTFNECFEVLWAGKYMRLSYPKALKEAFSSNAQGEQWPVSFWIRRIK